MAITKQTARKSIPVRKRKGVYPDVRVESTYWASPSALRRLGIERDVTQLLEEMGLPGLENFRYPTYYQATKAFFTSLEFSPGGTFGGTIEHSRASFYIGKKYYTFSCEDLCEAWEFPNDLGKRYERILWRYQFWNVITGEPWIIGKTNWLKIRNPVIRYIALLLSNTLMARRQTGDVLLDEMSLMYRGLAKNFDEERPEMLAVNNAALFLRHILRQREEFKKSGVMGTICFGGMLTPLFNMLGIELEDYSEGTFVRELDEALLEGVKSGEVDGDGGYHHKWTVNGIQKRCSLPFLGHSCFITPENIAFERAKDKILALRTSEGTERNSDNSGDQTLDEYSSSSNDEIPDDLNWERRETPIQPRIPETPESAEWAHYTNELFKAQRFEIERVRDIAYWSYMEQKKTKEKFRNFEKMIQKRYLKPEPKEEAEDDDPPTDEESRKSEPDPSE